MNEDGGDLLLNSFRKWLSFFIVLSILECGWIWAKNTGSIGKLSVGQSPSQTQSANESLFSVADPPEGVRAKLAEALSPVPYLTDLVIQSANHQQLDVSAEISTPPTLDNVSSQQLGNWAMTYFQAVYQSGLPVGQAELDVMVNGQLVATAGMGKIEYEALAAVTAGQEGSNWQAMLHDIEEDPSNLQSGTTELWYQASTLG